MSNQRNFDANPGLVIPRMTFEFDPSGVGEQQEFSIEIPNSDIETAVVLPNPLDYMPEPSKESVADVLEGLSVENAGGSLRVQRTNDVTTVKFGFASLPPRANVSSTEELNINKRFMQQIAPRLPHLEGREKVLNAVLRLTNVQYQFGIPDKKCDEHYPVPPARLSFADGHNIAEPRVIVTHEFDEVLRSVESNRSLQLDLTDHIFKYLVYIDKPNDGHNDKLWVMGDVYVAKYGRIFSNGESSLGQRTDNITQAELTDQGTDFDLRFQQNDAYLCQGHNLELVPQPQMIALTAVGAISRLCRERRQ